MQIKLRPKTTKKSSNTEYHPMIFDILRKTLIQLEKWTMKNVTKCRLNMCPTQESSPYERNTTLSTEVVETYPFISSYSLCNFFKISFKKQTIKSGLDEKTDPEACSLLAQTGKRFKLTSFA